MARRRKLTEGKKNIIAGLIEEYDIKTANDIQEALKDLLGGTIQEMELSRIVQSGVRIFFCKLSFCGKIYIFQGRAFVLPSYNIS